MNYQFFRRKYFLIITISVVLIIYLFWQTAIVEIALIAQFDGSRNVNLIALSFDDGPDWGEEVLLSALNEYGIRATFFWTLEKMYRLRDMDIERFNRILELIEEGEHEIGVHGYFCNVSWNPVDMFLFLHDQEDVLNLKKQYYELIGEVPKLYRSHGPKLGRAFYDSLKHSSLALAFGSVEYQISVHANVDRFIEYFQKAETGKIICGHDSKDCNPTSQLAESIAEIVPELKRIAESRNLRIVSISELLNSSETPN